MTRDRLGGEVDPHWQSLRVCSLLAVMAAITSILVRRSCSRLAAPLQAIDDWSSTSVQCVQCLPLQASEQRRPGHVLSLDTSRRCQDVLKCGVEG